MAFCAGGKRNVIVLGKSGCGKSTLANKIICQDGAFKVSSLSPDVAGKIINVIENVNIDGLLYTINMIDTAGLQGLRGRDGKNDKELMKQIKKQLKKRAPEGLNLIIFVLRNGEFTDEESKVFRRITKKFSAVIKELSLLVITGCDGKKGDRDDLVQKFKTNPSTKSFAEIMGRGIFCVNLPDTSNLSEEEKEAVMKDMIPIHKAIAEARLLYLHDEI